MPRNGEEKDVASTVGEGGGGGPSRPSTLGSAEKAAQTSQAALGRKISTQVVRQRRGTFTYKKWHSSEYLEHFFTDILKV